jgi:hypothetical protein
MEAQKTVHVGFIIDKVILEQTFLRILRYPPVTYYSANAHCHQSTVTSKMGPFAAAAPWNSTSPHPRNKIQLCYIVCNLLTACIHTSTRISSASVYSPPPINHNFQCLSGTHSKSSCFGIDYNSCRAYVLKLIRRPYAANSSGRNVIDFQSPPPLSKFLFLQPFGLWSFFQFLNPIHRR